MMRPFNPEVINQSGIAQGQSVDNILRFSDQKQFDTEKKGVLWQSREAKRFGRAVRLFIGRRHALEAKLHLQLEQPEGKGLSERSIKVVDRELCRNLINHYQQDPISAIHQAEINLLEAVVSENQNGVNDALDGLKGVFQLYFPDDWPEKYQAFLRNESKEILNLSQKHSDQGFIARMIFGKPKYKKMMEILDKKIGLQHEELKKVKQARVVQRKNAQRRMPRPAQENHRQRQPEKSLLNRTARPVASPHRHQNQQQNGGRTNTQEAALTNAARETGEVARQLAFDIVRSHSSEIKARDYKLAMDYDLLNSYMVEALLKEGDVSHAVQTFKELVLALRDDEKEPGLAPEKERRTLIQSPQQGLMHRLVGEKDFAGKPLVSSESEFKQLMAGLPDGSVSVDKIISSLQHFRKLQNYQDMIKVRFTPEMYSILLRSNALERDVMEVDREGMDNETFAQLNRPELLEEMRISGLKAAFSAVGKYMDVVPDRTAIDDIRAANMEPYASGLHNWGNNCFMNASLQMIAIQMAAPELSDVVLDYQPAGLTEDQTMLYLQLQQSFLNVCDAINDRESHPVALVNLQRQFMQDYLIYSQATGRQSASFILADQQPDNLRPALIPQQDPHEFLNDLTEIFGLNQHPRCSVHLYDHKKMIYQGKERLRKTVDEGGNAFLPISVNRQGSKTISRCVSAHLSPEKLDEFNQFKWDRADKARVGLAGGDQVDTLKQQAFVSSGHQPPDRLMLQMKIFGFENGTASKLNDEAATLMAYSGRRVRIPIAPDPDSEPENQEYDMTGIVCHRGSSSTSGHYVSLRFEGDKVIVCDDDVVLELNEYARFRGRPAYKNWQDFCAKEKLTGYLFSLQKVKGRAMALGG